MCAKGSALYIPVWCENVLEKQVTGTVIETETHAAMERLAADSGLTSATSLAFCRASF